jgi:dienelactone hydrolase
VADLVKIAVFTGALLIGQSIECASAESQSTGTLVELETQLASSHPLAGYLRRPNREGPLPAVVLLHSCNGNWRQTDERWGKRIASWGYVTLAVDSFAARGIKSSCRERTSSDFTSDAYRALTFLARHPAVDPARVAAIGFSMGGLFVLASVERGAVEQSSSNKFRAAVAFYPPCATLTGNMTVPTLILIGERDDLNSADDCRSLAAGRDGMGISREKNRGIPIKLIVYPDAYHAFDAPGPQTPTETLGHHFEFNQAATDQSVAALREFLNVAIGDKEKAE